MSWLYSRALVEEYSVGTFLDGAQSALWSTTHTPRPSWLPAKTTDVCCLSRSGMTFAPLTETHGEAVLMSFLEAFPAKTSAPQEKAQDLTAQDLDCGWKWPESWVKYDHRLSLWRTRQHSLLGGLEEFSETWPIWGSMRNGECWGRQTLALILTGNGSGFWPAPARIDEDFCRMTVKSASMEGHQAHMTTELIRRYGQRFPLPSFGEGMIGFPIGWIKAGDALGIASLQSWQRSCLSTLKVALGSNNTKGTRHEATN
jgi:hypothetical protein